MKKNILSIIAISLILLGCIEKSETIRPIEQHKVTQAIKLPQMNPLPTAEEILNNKPSYSQGRDPFRVSGIFANITRPCSYEIAPLQKIRMQYDPTRAIGYKPDPLEKYELNTLTMVGTMHQADGELAALIDIGDNKIIMVHENDHIGRDHERITKINENRVVIEEKYTTIEEPMGWLMMPNEILLKAK